MSRKANIKLHIQANNCCSIESNLVPITICWVENGQLQVGVTHFCKECGWISLNNIATPLGLSPSNDADYLKEIQKAFDLLTQKVEYICFLDKVQPAIAAMMNKKILRFDIK